MRPQLEYDMCARDEYEDEPESEEQRKYRLRQAAKQDREIAAHQKKMAECKHEWSGPGPYWVCNKCGRLE
jgi:hypothetical protein